MKLYKNLVIGTVLGLLAVSSVGIVCAADTLDLTLDESIQLALKNNRAIKEYVTDFDNSQWALKEVRRGGGPTFSWTSTAEKIGGNAYSGSGYNKEFANTLEASIPLYTSGKLENKIKSADYGIVVAQLNLENEKQTIRNTVTQDYCNILQYRSQIQVYQDSVNDLQAHLDNVNAKYKAGTVAKSDVLSSEVSLANGQQNLTSAQNDYDIAIATFNNDVGLNTDAATNIKDDLKYTKYDIDIDKSISYALSHRPDAVAKYYEVQAAKANVETAKAAAGPQISAVAAYNTAGSNLFSDGHTSSDYWGAGISASWSIFDNNITQAQVKQKEAALRKAEESALAQNDAVRLEVRTAYLNLITSEKNIKTLSTSVDKAKDDYRIEKVRYNAGVGTNLDILDAEEKLLQAEGDYVTALYEYNTSKASLDKAMGIAVDLDAEKYKASIELKN